MYDKITEEQYKELVDAESFETREFHDLLERYTGITAQPCRVFAYYDSASNYLGDSTYCDVKDLLANAYIEVVKEDYNDG